MVKSVVIVIGNKDIPTDKVKRDKLLCTIKDELQKAGWADRLDGICVTCPDPIKMLKQARKGGEGDTPAISLAHDLRLPMTKFVYCKPSEVDDKRRRLAIIGHGLGDMCGMSIMTGLPFVFYMSEDLD